MKRTILFLAAFVFAAVCMNAQTTTPRWLRQNAVSPDGGTVAFVYQGDIFTVPSSGGEAVQITSNPAHDTEPLWSPDGRYIVFASFREGGKDIWAVPAEGGTPCRLTDFGGAETPLAVAPDGSVYFSAVIQEDAVSAAFPGGGKLYRLGLGAALEAARAGRDLPAPVQVLSTTVGNVSVNAGGVILYQDRKGYEDALRKHHTSAVTRDIWKTDGTNFTKLTDYVGEDTNPVWAPDGVRYYYLSERGGARKGGIDGEPAENPAVGDWGGDSNVFTCEGTQLTHFADNPVRYLSISRDGLMCFSWNGDLYTMREGQEPAKLQITLRKDKDAREHIWRTASGSGNIAVSPNGKEIAVVSRGDVYTTMLELDDTRRITETAGQERNVSFGKDGLSLYYDSERDGEWAVYRRVLKDKKDKYFTFSYNTAEERLTPAGQICFQPVVSPDGKKFAYLRNRSELMVADADGGNPRCLLQGANFSYSDGDMSFAWSPDSRWLLTNYQGGGRMYNEDIALVNVETGALTDLTLSGYSDVNFRWAMDGRAMTWETDRDGYRSHGSWGAEGDIYIMFFDDEAYSKFRRSKDVEDIEKLLQDPKDQKKEEKKEARDSANAAKGKVEPLKMELSRREDRIVRLTRSSGRIGSHFLTNEGDKLYYTVQLEKGRDLCCLDLRKGDVRVVRKGVGGFTPAPDGRSLYINGRTLEKFDLPSEKGKTVSFQGEYEYFPDKEREYIFEHCWRQVKEKFYLEDMHGVDWAAVGENYRQFLPYITDNFAFQELLSEMLGELNGSHTGGRYRNGSGVPTGHLGVIFDEKFAGPGLRIAEFLPGSLLLAAEPSLKPGDVITAIDGEPVPAGRQWYQALSRKAGRRILLSVAGKQVYVQPASSDSRALYERWVRHNEAVVEELSGGRIGYVHVESMDSGSFREVFSKALGKYRNCDALIVDTRHNGGGWLHNDLATFLNGKLYTERRTRMAGASPEPYDKWNKPSCVLVCEDNYSDACGFPYVYRSLGIGKIIGAPIAGTATSVWWETQVDPTLVFGIPQVGSWSILEGRFLENDQLEPDIVVYNDPGAVQRGEDAQLKAAVAEMLHAAGHQEHYSGK